MLKILFFLCLFCPKTCIPARPPPRFAAQLPCSVGVLFQYMLCRRAKRTGMGCSHPTSNFTTPCKKKTASAFLHADGFWRRWWDSNPRARLRTKRFRVFEPVGGSWFRSVVIGSCRHFLRLAKVAHHRNLQAKINHFLRSAVRKPSFHTERQGLHFRCSSVRCSLEYYSAAVAVPAHSRLPCLNAAFPESREMLRFLLPALG